MASPTVRADCRKLCKLVWWPVTTELGDTMVWGRAAPRGADLEVSQPDACSVILPTVRVLLSSSNSVYPGPRGVHMFQEVMDARY